MRHPSTTRDSAPTRDPAPTRGPLGSASTDTGAGLTLRTRLDDLAARVATELETGALDAAWTRTRALERQACTDVPDGQGGARPPAPVIGRRFAAAHRRLLAAASAAARPAA